MKKNIFFIIVLFIFIKSCYTHHYLENTGDIYGQLELKIPGNNPSITNEEVIRMTTVRIKGFDKFSKLDSKRTFYIPNIPPGEYTLIAEVPNIAIGIKNKVQVSSDSISLVYNFGILYPKRKRHIENIWKVKKIRRVDVTKRGAISGYIYLNDTIKKDNAIIAIDSIELGTTTNYSGYFYFDGLLPGKYNVRGDLTGYGWVIVENVFVVPDSVSIVKLKFSPPGFWDSPYRYEWKKMRLLIQ